MTTIQIIVLAVVQGLTEFLPISSSGHLVLVPYLVEWTDQGLAFDVAVHFGSLLAVVAFFREDIAGLLRGSVQLLGGDTFLVGLHQLVDPSRSFHLRHVSRGLDDIDPRLGQSLGVREWARHAVYLTR